MMSPEGNKWEMDLVAILIASLVLVPVAIFTSGALRIVLGLPFLLFFPGYVLIAALFARKESLGGVERIALSFGLSIAVVPLIGLILNYTPWGIRLYPILISLSVFILAMCVVAWRRRRNLPPEQRFGVSFSVRLPSWQEKGKVDKALSLVLVVAIIGVIGTLAYVVAIPKVGERFTEFYILGPYDKAEGYTTNLTLGEKGEVVLGIVNHEQEGMSYHVKVMVNGTESGVRIWLGDEGGGTTLVANNTIGVGELANEEKWERKVFFEPLSRGEGQKLEFLLFSPGLREDYHIRSELDSGGLVDMEINEAEGNGEITVDNNSTASSSYRLEVWQGDVMQKEISFTVAGGEKLEKEVEFPAGKSIFRLYEDDKLALKDRGDELSLHLWLNVS